MGMKNESQSDPKEKKDHKKSHSRSRSRSRSHSHSNSRSSKSSHQDQEKHSSGSKTPKQSKNDKNKDKKQQPEEKKEMFPNLFGLNKHFPLPLQGGLLAPPYGAPFMPFMYRPPPMFYPKKPFPKMFDGPKPDDSERKGSFSRAPRDDTLPLKNKMGYPGSSYTPKPIVKKTINDIMVFKKDEILPVVAEIFLTVQALPNVVDQNLYMNLSKKLMADFEKKCGENKMKHLAKSLGRYLVNFGEMIKKEKEKDVKEKKKGKNEDGDKESSRTKELEVVKCLHEIDNLNDLMHRVGLEGIGLELNGFNFKEKCVESKAIYEETKDIFRRNLNKRKGIV